MTAMLSLLMMRSIIGGFSYNRHVYNREYFDAS